jgi:exosortase A
MSARGITTLRTSVRGSEPVASQDWLRALSVFALTVVFIVAVYWETAASMVRIWARSDTFAHGFLVPLIVFWLVWRKRVETAMVSPRPAWNTMPLLLLAGLFWLAGELAAANSVSQLSFVALLIFSVPAVLGTRVARINAFALAFLLFAVPVGEFVMPQLMEWTADFVVLGLHLSGIPVYREGQQLVIPSGSWSVIEACSGVRYLIASVTVGTLFAYLTYRSLKRRLLFIGVAIIVPILANWVRAFMVVMLGHLSGNRLAVGVDHLIYGWVFFGFVIVLMFWIGMRWREDGQAEAQTLVPEAPLPVSAANRVWLGAIVVGLLASVGFSARAYVDASVPMRAERPDLILPSTMGDWNVAGDGKVDWKPHFENPAAEARQVYRRGGDEVGLYIALYRNQDHDRKLISSTNVLVTSTDADWKLVGNGQHEIAIDPRTILVKTAELRGPQQSKWAAWEWYWIDGKITASEPWAKILMALARLRGDGDDSAAIVIYAAQDARNGAETALASFAVTAVPTIDTVLRQAGKQP